MQQKQINLLLPVILCFIFVCLKTVGLIHWSWFWVFAPAWAPVMGVGLLGIYLAFNAPENEINEIGKAEQHKRERAYWQERMQKAKEEQEAREKNKQQTT